MRYQIVNGLGFSELRPVQEETILQVVEGCNCVVLAPTAGGKTEAAFFPLLSRMDDEDWRPVSVLYVSPIRALLNNQEARLARYAELIGRRAALWHGDTAQRARSRIVREPPDILLTTPESLEVMMMSRRVPARRLFAGLQAVVIDEIHAFVSDDRGGHLASVLERLTRFCGNDIQRIGLSATVGNPEVILEWMAGSSERAGAVIDPPKAHVDPALAVDYVGSLENAARVIAQLHPGKKRLVFVDSRRGVEALGSALGQLGTDTWVLHSSLSADRRGEAERAFAEGSDRVIVATSTLELGIDIGDLDHVLQVDAPSTVASFMQRMGRTGRRAGTVPNCTFLATDEDALVQCAAIVRLYREGYVEPVEPVRRAAHLLAHQIMALSIQHEGGVPRDEWWAWLRGATPFAELSDSDRNEVVAHMLQAEVLAESAARLTLGRQGEKLYGRRNFQELYSVFSTPQLLRVLHGLREVGAIEASFVNQFGVGELVFQLGGRAWRANRIDWSAATVSVEPAESGRYPRWRGTPRLLSGSLCQAIRGVLADDVEDPSWTRRAKAQLALARESRDVPPGDDLVLADDGVDAVLWTYAGGRANNLVARLLESSLGERVSANNLSVRFTGAAARSTAAIRQAITELRDQQRPTADDALLHAESCARSRLSKFQACLPPALEAAYLASQVVSAEESRRLLSRKVILSGSQAQRV